MGLWIQSASKLGGLQVGVLLVLWLASHVIAWWFGVVPCVICEVQRLLLVAMLALGLARFWVQGRWLWLCQLVLLGLGTTLSVHHIRLQGMAAKAGQACLPDLWTLLHIQPLWRVWQGVLAGGGCQDVVAPLWGVPLPEWLLAAQVGLWLLWLVELKSPSSRRRPPAICCPR